MKNVSKISGVILLIFLIHACEEKPTPPVITTTTVTDISYTTATSGGDASNEGGAPIVSKGVCWNTSADPTINNNKTIESSGLGTFTSILTQLTPNTVYYLRAYATNSAGTGYGSQFSFTTLQVAVPAVTTIAITSITQTTATSGGDITTDNGSTITARGVCWSTSTNPTTSLTTKTTDTGTTGIFTSSITGLATNTIYYVKAYATNSVGTSYGNEISFTTQPATVPTLTTTAVSSITGTTATSGGNVTSDGGASITARGVCWSTTTNPDITGNITSNSTGTGNFESNIIGLTPGSTYYVRAYATNSAGTAYGNELSFATSAVLPTLTTTAASLITATTATSGGNITSEGGASVTARGVCWSTSANPTTADNTTSNSTGSGSFVSNLSGLTSNTTYYVRAYATNSIGTAYGTQVSFKTAVLLPILTTDDVSAITTTTATSGGNITSQGGGPVTTRGVCWGTTTNPTTDNNKTDDGSGTGTFTSSLTGLTHGTTYYVRAYATISGGTAYGNEVSFTATIELPTLTSLAITSVTATTASSGGNITNDGGAPITARGVCFSTSPKPTTSNSLTTDGTGIGAFISNMTGLIPGTLYYVRTYATNSAGTIYGDDIIFKTYTGTVTDIDKNVYNTVTIGTQVWIAENLKTTKYDDGTAIPLVNDDLVWRNLLGPGYCWYNNDATTYKATYGALYKWYVVNTGKLCPTGWHVPSDAEWSTMENYLIANGYNYDGTTTENKIAKSLASNSGWTTSTNTGSVGNTDYPTKRNATGFTALPGGRRDGYGTFGYVGDSVGWWWSATKGASTENAWSRYMFNANSSMYRGYDNSEYGFSVRCVKDN